MFNVCPLAARVRKTNEAATTLTLRPRRHARRRLWLPRAELAFGDLFFNARSGSGVASTPTTVTRDSGISSARPRGARAKRGVVASLVTRSEHLQSRGVAGLRAWAEKRGSRRWLLPDLWSRHPGCPRRSTGEFEAMATLPIHCLKKHAPHREGASFSDCLICVNIAPTTKFF